MPDAYDNCKDLFAVLSSYLDGELPPADCAVIEAHIAQCPPCVEFVASLRRSRELCRETDQPVEIPPLTADVREQLMAAYRDSLASLGRRPG